MDSFQQVAVQLRMPEIGDGPFDRVPEGLGELSNFLRMYATGRKRILEIGCHEGTSALGFGQAAEYVLTVDTFWKNDKLSIAGDDGTASTLMWAFINLRRFRNIGIVIGDSAVVLPQLVGTKWDLIYIDGKHTAEYVRSDILLSLPLLATDGVIACHDYDSGCCADVKPVIDGLIAQGMVVLIDHNENTAILGGRR